MIEKTLAIIKPDAFKRKLTGAILHQIEKKFTISALKACCLTNDQSNAFYAIHKDRPFYSSLTHFMASGPLIVLVLSGHRVINIFREFIGTTDPARAKYGTIRRMYGTSVERNVIHGSDSPETAKSEISFFFNDSDFFQ